MQVLGHAVLLQPLAAELLDLGGTSWAGWQIFAIKFFARKRGKNIFCKFLAGSFSAVPKQIFARKYAFDSIFQALQDVHTFAPLQSQNFSKKSV